MTDRDLVRGRRAVAAVAALVVFGVAAVSSHDAVARFVDTQVVGGNAFTSANPLPPTGLTATVRPAGVRLSWTASTTPRLTGTRIYRATTSGGPYTQVAQVVGTATTFWDDAPGLGTYYYVARSYASTNYVGGNSNQATWQNSTMRFAASTGNVATNCRSAAQRERDMLADFTPAGPEETQFRNNGIEDLLTFCSVAVPAGKVLAAGTTTVNAYIDNTAGSECGITATLWRNGTTSLGTGSITINPSGVSLRTWSFATTGFTFAAGDRLNVQFTWGAVKACAETTLYYGSAANPSAVTVPQITG